MKSTLNKQSGSIIEWLIIGVVLIGAVALIAWRYSEADKDQNNADQAANNQSSMQQPKDSVKLGDWGVEVKDTQKKYGTITASLYKQESSDVYMLTSSKLLKGTFTCEPTPDIDKGLLGTVVRSDSDDPMLEDVKIGDKYYGFMPGYQNTCYKEAELNVLAKEFAQDLSKLLVETKPQ